jgi:multidrug transporter EmrE-like cation transporter
MWSRLFIAVALFFVAIVGQVAGNSLLPRTRSFTDVAYVVASLGAFTVSSASMARLMASGISLGVVIPIMSTAVPLGVVAVGIVAYGEPTSPVKISLLLVACVLVSIAARL